MATHHKSVLAAIGHPQSGLAIARRAIISGLPAAFPDVTKRAATTSDLVQMSADTFEQTYVLVPKTVIYLSQPRGAMWLDALVAADDGELRADSVNAMLPIDVDTRLMRVRDGAWAQSFGVVSMRDPSLHVAFRQLRLGRPETFVRRFNELQPFVELTWPTRPID